MTQERTTSLRILQTNKKKPLSPVIYVLIGFLSGVVLTSLMFFLFVGNSSPTDPAISSPEPVEEENHAPHSQSKVAHGTEEAMVAHPETSESVEDNDFAQPGSNDLNKFFQRAPAAAAPTGQHVSPFANEPNVKPTQTVTTTKLSHAKNEPAPANKVVKPAAQASNKIAPAQVAEPEAEAPEATVQIKVTQKPFAVNELK